MFLRKLSWAQLTKGGVPPLFVLRPLPGGFTPPDIGAEYPAPADKGQMLRARQLYEQRRIGTQAQLEVARAKTVAAPPAPAPIRPAKAKKENHHGKG